jgi:mRNA interferase RelE/StbE
MGTEFDMEKIVLVLDPAKQVNKFLSKQTEVTAKRLVKVMDKLRIFPLEGIDISPIVGRKGTLRVRVGDYRIIIRIDLPNRIVYIDRIDNRGDIYKKY